MRRLLFMAALLACGCEGCHIPWCELLPVPCPQPQYIPPPGPAAGASCQATQLDHCAGDKGPSLTCRGGIWVERERC